MTDQHSAAETDAVAHHDAVAHMDTHTVISDDDHGHAEPRLGPIDWAAWGYAAVGIVFGLFIVILLAAKLTTGG